jgi:hypothetical protein
METGKYSLWAREVEGIRFYSVTVRGFKFAKTAGCRYVGQYAVYPGPLKAVLDEEGHLFPRGVPIEICTDTAAKLAAAPYAGPLQYSTVRNRPRRSAASTTVAEPTGPVANDMVLGKDRSMGMTMRSGSARRTPPAACEVPHPPDTSA